jgi:acid phosphatase family membrane protein YuiD
MTKNKTLMLALLAWLVAQIIKVLINLIKTKKLDLGLLLSSGGMPSSHSALVSSMSMSIGLSYGFKSNLFALSLIISLIVMYDAAGVRRAAGKQAAVLNILLEQIEKQGIKIDVHLKELLGHNPIEVGSGALLGSLLTFLLY